MTWGASEEFEQALARLEELEADRFSTEIALVHAWIGDVDQAFYWMEKEWNRDGGSAGWAQFPVNPELASVREDPRWLPFLRKIGIAPEQLAEIRFEAPLPRI